MHRQLYLKIYILVTAFIFLLRIIIFNINFGGVEHDSAWYLGIAKNLARNGIYASFTNTVAQEGKGNFPSIHGKWSVQDDKGFVYFPAGVTVGPSYVVPEALILKVFGNGEWQYRAWPHLTFFVFLVVIFYLTFQFGGLLSLLLLQVWLWALPQLTINFAYEAFSEHLALLFLLFSFIFYHKGRPAFSGLFLGLSFLTKTLYILNGLIFLPLFIFEIIKFRKNLKSTFSRLFFFFLSFISPILLFESYRYLFLASSFGKEAWDTVNNEIRQTFLISGSGLNNLYSCTLDDQFILNKFKLWWDIGLYKQWYVWIIYLILPLFLYKIPKEKRFLSFIMYLSSLISLIWFVFLSSTGWGRHIFQSLIISMILFSSAFGILFKTSKKIYFQIIVLTSAGLFAFYLLSLPKSSANFVLNQNDIDKWYTFREERGIQHFPFAPILNLKEQEKLVEFINDNIKPEERIYYNNSFLVAEISTLSDRIFFPVKRYREYRDNKNAFLILGPYQLSRFKLVNETYVDDTIKGFCSEVIYKDENYLVCKLKPASEISLIN